MRTIDADYLNELDDHQIRCLLFYFTFNDVTYAMTTLDVPVYHALDTTSTITFNPRGFLVGNISNSVNSVVNSMDIKIDNRDKYLGYIFVGEDTDDIEAELWGCILDSDGEVIGVEALFKGYINEFKYDEEEVSCTITNRFTKLSHLAYSTQNSRCRWKKFKGTRCGYSGNVDKCDSKVETCIKLGNYDNFGGFEYLPDLENKEVQWGPKLT